MRLRTGMRLTGIGLTGMVWVDTDPRGAGLMGKDREDKHRKGSGLTGMGHRGTHSMEQGCERRCGAGDCAES
jgi:hypothetical protein